MKNVEYYSDNIRNDVQLVDATLTRKQFLAKLFHENENPVFCFFSDFGMKKWRKKLTQLGKQLKKILT